MYSEYSISLSLQTRSSPSQRSTRSPAAFSSTAAFSAVSDIESEMWTGEAKARSFKSDETWKQEKHNKRDIMYFINYYLLIRS